MSRPPRRFFRKAIKGQHDAPRTITLDGYAASHRAVRELKAQSDRAGPSGRETANRHDAGLQGLRDRGDSDRRYRIDASPQGTIRTGTSGCPRSTCACSVECRAPSLKSRQYKTGRFPPPAICTRAITGTMVESIDDRGVTGGGKLIPCGAVLWTAGVSPSPLVKMLGVATDRAGRACVSPSLSVPDTSGIYSGSAIRRR